MVFNLFNKTKDLDKLYSLYMEQYANIQEALEKFFVEEENLDYKHGIKMFGNLKEILQEQIDGGVDDLKNNLNHIFEIEFTKLKHDQPKALAKWIKQQKVSPILKFASDDFLDVNYDFIVENMDITTINLEDVTLHPVLKEVIKCKNIRNKYFNQVKILDKMNQSKNKSLLKKAHEKSFSVLKEKESYAKQFVSDFNDFIHKNLVFKTYDLEINFEKEEFDEKNFEEAVVFFSIIISLLENKKIGLYQPYKVFLEKKSLNNFNFDQNKWLDKFKHFGIEIIELEN